MGASGGCQRCVSLLLAACLWLSGAVWAEQVALVEVFVQQDSVRILQGQLLQDSLDANPAQTHHKKDHKEPDLQGDLRLMDLSQALSKPVIIIQTSENVTRLIGALLRGLHATAKITYKTFLQNNLGATLTLWSSCGRSRGGLYGEWQGVICTGETNSPVQKYLQQLWNTVVLVALILSTGVIVHARWQYHYNQFNDDLQLRPKQDLLKRLSALKTRTYRQPKAWSDPTHGQPETDSCAVCLEQYNNNQCLRVLPCLHEFHRDCVDPWLLLQQTCPLCKRSVLG
uniref:RING-type domain-containing protein n=1 Tax=Pygocentrus nattereri TaxID=42514 RepID=A0AAR2KHR7_PYGNA